MQPLLTAQEVSLDLLRQVGIGQVWQMPVLWAASALDVVLGLACFSPLRRRVALWAVQLVVVVVYSLIVGLCLPEHWLHPFAPLLKNLPIAALMFYLMKRSGK
ncbi:DoxX-like family protein [Neisseria wadsworthii]|uniref:NAD-dependent epimerase/dehydratase n=1 Tax=Neisseria wadsworthii 9715 TaxID=1030841 RepID=G4CTM4_9NEIS|nr:DoxX-like family protein [Neisseria wadsworthii]EGZ44129.1 NAD-dependent epimerase/dehydratase [Neisseria wadsworthii 9715]